MASLRVDRLASLGVSPAIPGPATVRAPLADQIGAGRLVEISSPSATGRLTTAVSLVIHAQRAGEPCAWIQPEGGLLYPPDLAASGVDWAVATPGSARAATASARPRRWIVARREIMRASYNL